MEAVIAILMVFGVLSASGVLPEESPPTADQETRVPALETSDPVARPACNQHAPVYRDLTVPYGQWASSDAAGETKATCNE